MCGRTHVTSDGFLLHSASERPWDPFNAAKMIEPLTVLTLFRTARSHGRTEKEMLSTVFRMEVGGELREEGGCRKREGAGRGRVQV
ncbi:hypothetical protein NDU88_004783 [Pleurodeles waltl]|uniref:Uncharacterized protein n=1 Tax=Pleurodeles waltl TaxID=8319 RepID=A0AAV7L0V7_PLEWA|nr:hypothetical protein NDU88_004783 [Pleurodeles waltl]